MLKASNRIFIGALTLAATAMAAETPSFKVAYVDLQNALQTVDSGKAAKSQLEKEMNAKRQSLEKAQQALQKETEEFEKKAAIMNETARAAKQTEIQKKIAEFQKSYG